MNLMKNFITPLTLCLTTTLSFSGFADDTDTDCTMISAEANDISVTESTQSFLDSKNKYESQIEAAKAICLLKKDKDEYSDDEKELAKSLARSTTFIDQPQRNRVELDFFLGKAYDQFSGPAENYLNYGQEDEKWRYVLGAALDYRLFTFGGQSFWLSGSTLRGVRTAEVNCEEQDGEKPALCTSVLGEDYQTTEAAKYIIQNASSFEANIGFRYEIAFSEFIFDKESDTGLESDKISLYFKSELGGIAVDDDDDDMADINSTGVGLIVREGPFRGSFIEYAEGQNDLFSENQKNREKYKVRFMYSDWELAELPARLIVQTVLDTDGGEGADSIQTFIGISFPLNSYF